MNKIKVGIVTSTFPPKGGGIATAHYNIYMLLKDVYEVKVFAYNDIENKGDSHVVKRKTPKWMLPIIFFFIKIYLRRFKEKDDFPNFMRIFSNSVGTWLLNKPIKKFAPDILIVPDNNVPLYWLKKGDFKIAWCTRNNYLRFRDNPLLTGCFWLDIDLARSMERKALKKADFVLSPSIYMIDEYHRAYSQKHSIYVINNFILEENLKKILDQKIASISSHKPIIFIPSGGSVNKGSIYTFEIIRRIAESFENQVDFYISGNITDSLRFELRHLHPDIKIFLPGHTSWENNLRALDQSHFVISPTLAENFSNAFVEALVLGKPVIAFDVGGNKEIIDDGVNGHIVPYLNINDMTERAIELLMDESKYNNFVVKAKEKGMAFSNPVEVLKQYEKVFKKILV